MPPFLLRACAAAARTRATYNIRVRRQPRACVRDLRRVAVGQLQPRAHRLLPPRELLIGELVDIIGVGGEPSGGEQAGHVACGAVQLRVSRRTASQPASA